MLCISVVKPDYDFIQYFEREKLKRNNFCIRLNCDNIDDIRHNIDIFSRFTNFTTL